MTRSSCVAKTVACACVLSLSYQIKFCAAFFTLFPGDLSRAWHVRLIRCYLQYIHTSRNRRHAFRLRRLAESGCPRRVLLTTALSLWCRAHFRTWWRLFVAGARETSCFGAPKSTCRDRRKGSELFYFEMQFSWQVRHFGHGGDR